MPPVVWSPPGEWSSGGESLFDRAGRHGNRDPPRCFGRGGPGTYRDTKSENFQRFPVHSGKINNFPSFLYAANDTVYTIVYIYNYM